MPCIDPPLVGAICWAKAGAASIADTAATARTRRSSKILVASMVSLLSILARKCELQRGRAQAQRVADDRHRAEGHRQRRDLGAEQDAEGGVEHACSDR